MFSRVLARALMLGVLCNLLARRAISQSFPHFLRALTNGEPCQQLWGSHVHIGAMSYEGGRGLASADETRGGGERQIPGIDAAAGDERD